MFDHRLHLSMHHIDRLEGPDHDLELGDQAIVIAGDDVDAIYILAVDRHLKFQHRLIALEDLLYVVKLAVITIREIVPGVGHDRFFLGVAAECSAGRS